MLILLIGAYGFIGSEIARMLLRQGHEVRGFGRDIAYGRRILPDVEWVHGDLAHHVDPASWAAILGGVDAVVNASGLLQNEPGRTVSDVQHHAIAALIAASGLAGVNRFVQISAANAEVDAPSSFLASKALADSALDRADLSYAIIRPGLVIGRNAYGGTELIRMAATFPWITPLPCAGGAIQCIGMADLVAAVGRVVDPAGPAGSFDMVEERRRSLREIIALHRAWLGLAPARHTVSLSGWAMAIVAVTADMLGILGWRSPLRTNAITSLRHGISGDAAQAEALLDRAATPLDTLFASQPAGRQDRLSARLGLLLPLMLASLFTMWLGSAAFTMLDLERAVGLLVEGGLGPAPARVLAVGGAIMDGVLALLLLHRRSARLALMGMVLVTLAYLAGASVVRPDLWTDPLAPLLKTLPAMMLALACLPQLERR